MAGQLGLDPPTMILRTGDPGEETDQALKNCEAVANSFNGSLSSSSILLVTYCSSRLTLPERNEVQLKVEAFLKCGASSLSCTGLSSVPDPVFLYILAPDLPKRYFLFPYYFYEREKISTLCLFCEHLIPFCHDFETKFFVCHPAHWLK